MIIITVFNAVSVPFRGSCSEIRSYATTKNKLLAKVSVPFRGSCSEIAHSWSVHAAERPFPSPFGVRVLKSACMRILGGENGRFRPLSGFVF